MIKCRVCRVDTKLIEHTKVKRLSVAGAKGLPIPFDIFRCEALSEKTCSATRYCSLKILFDVGEWTRRILNLILLANGDGVRTHSASICSRGVVLKPAYTSACKRCLIVKGPVQPL